MRYVLFAMIFLVSAAHGTPLVTEGAPAFKKLDPLEKFFITKNKSYWNDIQDSGGLSGNFFGLAISSATSQGDSLFIDTLQPPNAIRSWAERLCGIQPSSWDIQRSAEFTAGKGSGTYCDADYQPLNKTTWSVSVKGPKTLPQAGGGGQKKQK